MSDISPILVYEDGSPRSESIISFVEKEGVPHIVAKSYDFRVEIGLMVFRDMGELLQVLRKGGYIKKQNSRAS